MRTFLPSRLDFVVTLRGKEIEALRADRLHEGPAGAGQNHNAIVRVGTDGCERDRQDWFMNVPIKDSVPPSVVQRHFQHTTFSERAAALRKLSR